MSDSPKDRAVGQGNHKNGYRGAIIRDWGEATERVVARCKHTSHMTATEARTCVGSAWFHGHDIDNISLTNQGAQHG